jgi:hypothetical protein
MSGPDWDIDKIKNIRRRDARLKGLGNAIRQADEELAAEEAATKANDAAPPA